jgi:hypothetical protein
VQVCLVDELGHYRASMTAAAGACEPVTGRIRGAGRRRDTVERTVPDRASER